MAGVKGEAAFQFTPAVVSAMVAFSECVHSGTARYVTNVSRTEATLIQITGFW